MPTIKQWEFNILVVGEMNIRRMKMARSVEAIERRTEKFKHSIDDVSYRDLRFLAFELKKWKRRAETILKEYNETRDIEYSRKALKMEDFDNGENEGDSL